VNQATPSMRWLNYKPKRKKKKKKRINTLTPLLLNHVFLNVWIMVCSELVAHNSWNASLQRINHHIIRGQSLLIIAACAWNEERLSLLFLSRSKISTSLANPFWVWIIYLFIYFSFIKKSRLRSHPTLGASEISMIKKKDRAVRKPKGKRAKKKNSNARWHAQITRKSDNQDKVSML